MDRLEPAVAAAAQEAEAILVIDDEASVREAASGALRYFGYVPLEASSAEAGLELLRAHLRRVSLVLLDVSMPGMGCRRCIEELRRLAPELPVVLVSGFGEPAEELTGPDPQVRGFLAKPFRLRDLESQIRAALHSA
jgi:CheY-like chemotaxis protein